MMKNEKPLWSEFTEAQWSFLGFLEACDAPVSMDLAGAVNPILPGEFLTLQAICEELGWIQKSGPQVLRLTADLPPAIRGKLKGINSPERLSAYLARIETLNLSGQAGPAIMAHLLSGCGRDKEAIWLETDLALKALNHFDYEGAKSYIKRSMARLTAHTGDAEMDTFFISNVLLLSKHYFTLGTELETLPSLLQEAGTRAEHLGDRRSYALIQLHRGRLLNLARKRSEALSALSAGLEEAAKINDADMQTQSAEFLGIYYFIQGLYKDALVHFERAQEAFETQGKDEMISPTAMVYLGYSAAYAGQFQHSVGTFDYYLRLARERGDRSIASVMRAGLGTVLLMTKKNSEAFFHLKQALVEAEKTQTSLGLYLSRGGLSFLHYLEGREKEAFDLQAQNIKQAVESGIMRHYTSPFILEMLFAFDRLGYDPVPGFNFESEIEKIHNEPNIHLRGVALRLQAKKGMDQGLNEALVLSYLMQSQEYLKSSGDPVELARTRLVMARLYLAKGNLTKARNQAQQARQGLSGDTEEFFPDDLRHLLEVKSIPSEDKTGRDYLFERFLDLMDDLVPHSNQELVITRLVAATNRFFGAERGGLFWFNDRKDKKVRLRAGCNLIQSDIAHKHFQSNLDLIRKTFRMNQPLVVRLEQPPGEPLTPRAILCIPVSTQGRVQGVLYHDNSYVNDCFDDIEPGRLLQLASRLSNHVDNILAFSRETEEKNRLLLRESAAFERTDDLEFLTRDPIMNGIMEQAGLMAASEAPVLLLGETGVGKEILARRIHQMSPRQERPFVILDATTIPENLFESELFGYEKGAFTGADQRKIGRLELAHQGTLFIDEIGELPLACQTKLLRALQEKTFTRLGGSKTQAADFSLVAATNRDLEKDIANGKFRRDLYYRINVMTITIPPLRVRPEDIIMLAEHFMAFFARRHKRFLTKLTAQDKERLISYHWPGNVRELKNVIERSVILSGGSRLELTLSHDSQSESGHPFADRPSMDELQRQYITYLLDKTRGKVSDVAQILGMNRATLYHRMAKLGLNQTDSKKTGAF
ncbi:MAG: sigma-54-dependent Fis family transcriptional regulator [Deltaproteobacteria bacterium]|nr:sigma-54-dependent Fis family transcriptional regulator [Deltaproteobacteria bacterium]